ncbi:M23 family metallopeptidase [[Clostridium] polysaccharolyticum]|uniref:Peptidase family M23 n=1 Tax=[Clostridium] polysaccharolyticum TaxID=29364 RepID=A0A1H9YWN2_9FIRM|nr:M23 family metallopeptidase [[Clostridium] polysaccharolyticum]SES73558.1 Peptidase family M23 [[Clostridium] polysaccharolyticum]
MKRYLKLYLPILCILAITIAGIQFIHKIEEETVTTSSIQRDYIKWVDFTVTSSAMSAAYKYDIESYQSKVHLNWIELLAYCAARTGGDFSKNSLDTMRKAAKLLTNKQETIDSLTKDLKYYSYYKKAYTAVLGGLVGEYEVEQDAVETGDKKEWVKKYGLKGFSPIACGYYYSDFDDFGVSRSYGYKRKHLGHDMMGCTGAPIIAVESGYVEALGWNQYGGWRIGIRSFDKQRYYYYAHLRKDFPFTKSLKVGSIVSAGDVIGYLGRTGYSRNANVNNIETPHLHFGLQLIFDEKQKDGNNEIWVDCYDLIHFLYQNRCLTQQASDGKSLERIYQFKDPAVAEYKKKLEKRRRNFIFSF